MRENFEYRGYGVSADGANYFARSLDDGDDLVMVSCDVERITQAIDQMWDGLEDGSLPAWFSEPAIDLDDPSIDHHFKPISVPQIHPYSPSHQLLFVLAALTVTVLFAVFMRFEMSECEPEVVFTLAVCAVATIGTLPAMALSVFSAFAYNYFSVPPMTAFSSPTRMEVVYFLINFLASVAIPMVLEWVVGIRRARVRTPNT